MAETTFDTKLKEKEQILKEREKSVARLEELKAKLEREHAARLAEVDKLKEQLLTDKNTDITKLNTKINELTSKISELSLQISKKESELASAKSTIELELQSHKNKKMIEIEQAYSRKYQQFQENLEKENKTTIEKLTKFLKWNETELANEFNKLIEQYESMLKSKTIAVDAELRTLSEARKLCEEKIEEYSQIEQLKTKLDLQEKTLHRKETYLDKLIDQEVSKRYTELSSELKKYKELYEDYLNRFNELSKAYETVLNDVTSAQHLDVISLKQENEALKKDKQKLVEKYGAYTDDSFNEIKGKANRVDYLDERVQELISKNQELELENSKYRNELNNNDSLKHQNEMLELQMKTERLYLAKLKDELTQLESRIDNTKTSVIASESIEAPYKEFIDKTDDMDLTKDEFNWLNSIIEKCSDSGFKFSKRLFYSFHTSLKTSDMSPLTVLAGVSGTGKSKLPQLYSRFGGLYFLSLPVQPDWDSPQSLFGYFNSIEKRFNATTLLRALVSFQKDKSKSDTKDNIYDLSNNVLLVLLDEMNLAHVELYFSELLSKLEEKRGEDKDISFEVDLGAGNNKYTVSLTDNVKWIGTMNEDETTKSLSDKVIDRGNIISFPRPEKFERYRATKLLPEVNKLKRTVWEDWLTKKALLDDEDVVEFMNVISEINSYLKSANRALGHRVWQSIENYMISHPLVVKYLDNEEKKSKALRLAFEEALVHKVMPKLRGIETDGELRENCLDPIKNIIFEHAPSLQKDFENAIKSITGTFTWDSAYYLENDYDLD